jgi:UDP-2,4-diacetamido-2,4,6-trideoxy-beta-L-altropyranose hydrolase
VVTSGESAAPRLFIRADASPAIGTGHVMRMLALAQAAQDAGWIIDWAYAEMLATVEQRLANTGIFLHRCSSSPGSVEDAQATAKAAKTCGARWVILDGYGFSAAFQKLLKTQGLHVMLLDDFAHADRYGADLVVNPNAYARADQYGDRAVCTQLRLGAEYVLLRPEFRKWRDWRREIAPVATHLLVTMGGSDPRNMTTAVLQALVSDRPFWKELIVVVGSGNPWRSSLEALISAAVPRCRMILDPPDMSSLMASADLALSSSGTTSWELCYMGLPTLLCSVADNQRLVGPWCHEMGVAHYLGWWAELRKEFVAANVLRLAYDQAARSTMASRGRALVDGRGARRLLELLQT